MNRPGSSRDPLPARLLSGAAGGALALVLVAAGEIALRALRGPALSLPVQDLGLLAAGGAAAGALIGLLRGIRALRFLAPFGLVLGTAVALHLWLGTVSGSRVLASDAAREAMSGLLVLLVGAVLGQLAGLALRRTFRPHPLRDAALAAVLIAPAFWPAGGGGASTADGTNLLLLSVDTLRGDRLGFAGSPHAFTPHLDRLARRSIWSPRAVTPLPRTLPAMVSVMTGAYPHEHGVRDNFHYTLAPDALTLAEALRDIGYATAAVNSNPVLSFSSGIYQGFESANDRGDDWSRLGIVRGLSRIATLFAMRGDRDQVITDLALRWLERRPRGRPWFLWVHWLAPHMPYEPPFPFDRLFDPGYDGPSRGVLDYGDVSKGDMTYRNPLPPRQIRHAIALYDGEVATSDAAVGRLLKAAARNGDLDRTEIVFLADHGESLDEHGYFFNHGDFVYGPAANVPWLWNSGGGAGVVSREPVSLHQLAARLGRDFSVPFSGAPAGTASVLFGESGFCRFPDLNDRLGYQLPPEIAQSPEAVPDWEERWAEQANRAKQRFVQDGDWKLVRSPHETGDTEELFDLSRDPGEREDVAALHPDIVGRLGELLDGWVAAGDSATTTAGTRTLDAETLEQMEALGYTGK